MDLLHLHSSQCLTMRRVPPALCPCSLGLSARGKQGLKAQLSKAEQPGMSTTCSAMGCYQWSYWHHSVCPVISPVPVHFNILFELVGPVPHSVHDYAFVYFGFHVPSTGPSIKLSSGLLKFPIVFSCSEHSVQFGSPARFFLMTFFILLFQLIRASL